MPIFDYECTNCGLRRNDVLIRNKDEEENQLCLNCQVEMEKCPTVGFPHIFPSDGIFLEHVSSEGKLFHSKKEMREYEKKHDINIDMLH